MEDKELVKFRRGVFIPKPKKRKRGNPNEYVSIPQEGEPTEYDAEDKYCPNCQKTMPSINMFVKDPIQPEDIGMKGEEVKPYWIQVCKKCKSPVEEGISVSDNFAKEDNETQLNEEESK